MGDLSEPRRKLILWIAAGLAILLVFGNQGFRDMASRISEKRKLDKTLASLRSEHERLSRELLWIQKDPVYAEYLVRKNLGYVKKGEVEYRLMKKGKQESKNP
jgi:cell division protein FtsB